MAHEPSPADDAPNTPHRRLGVLWKKLASKKMYAVAVSAMLGGLLILVPLLLVKYPPFREALPLLRDTDAETIRTGYIMGTALAVCGALTALFTPVRAVSQVPEHAYSLWDKRDLHGYQLILIVWGVFCITLYSVTHWIAPKEIGIALLIAALVSFIFDVGYHESVFGDHVKKISASVLGLSQLVGSPSPMPDGAAASSGTLYGIVGSLEKTLRATTKELDVMNNLVGYIIFRETVQAAYGESKKRIISVSDYWAIDPHWWENDQSWRSTGLYAQLKQSAAKRIVFAGNAPWPVYRESGASVPSDDEDLPEPLPIALEPDDFQRLLVSL